MSTVLGRVTSAADQPRGPDAKYRIRVPEDWLESGAKIQVEIPRNLECARCSGGGCDTCGGSGALTLRDRSMPAESVRLTLPQGAVVPESGARGLVLRIPDSGGHPQQGSDLPRGLLLLSIIPNTEADPGVRLAAPFEPAQLSSRPGPLAGWPRFARLSPTVVLAIIVAWWILFLITLRVSGHG